MRKRLTTSIPYWLLIVASLASAAGGASLLIDKLGTMTVGLTDGTATTVDVYVGQMWAVLGTVLIGAGAIGLLLALTLGAARALVPAAAPAVVEPPAWADDVDEEPTAEEATSDDNGYRSDLGYQANAEAAAGADASADADERTAEPAAAR